MSSKIIKGEISDLEILKEYTINPTSLLENGLSKILSDISFQNWEKYFEVLSGPIFPILVKGILGKCTRCAVWVWWLCHPICYLWFSRGDQLKYHLSSYWVWRNWKKPLKASGGITCLRNTCISSIDVKVLLIVPPLLLPWQMFFTRSWEQT